MSEIPRSKVLIGDVGGTNARFAIATSDDTYTDEQVLRCESFDSCEASIRHYLAMADVEAPDAIVLAVAGPVVDGKVTFPNSAWQLDEGEIKDCFGLSDVRLVNDFEAVAMCLPKLGARDLVCLGEIAMDDARGCNFTYGVVGPGTGLGAAGLVRHNGSVIAMITEAGHSGFAPQTECQREVLQVLAKRYERVSNERILSGYGLENLYSALCEINGRPDDQLRAADVFTAVGSNESAAQAAELWFQILGQVTGDFALSIGAFDGIYLGGGILQKHQVMLVESGFRASFDDKGRHRYLMQQIPTALITYSQPGLLGAAATAFS